jgi:hypothetical protein
MWTLSLRIGAASGLLLAFAPGCGHYGHRSEESLVGEVPLPAGTQALRIHLPGGPLTIRGGGPPSRVAYHMSVLRAADSAADLAILAAIDLRPAGRPTGPGEIDLGVGRMPPQARWMKLVCKTVLEVPAGIAVSARTELGPVAAIGCDAPVRLETGAGVGRLDRCASDCVVRTGGGDVIVNAHRGGLDLESARGMMQLWVDEVGASGLRAINRHGSIQVHVPADAAFSLDARATIPSLKVADKLRNSFGIPLWAHGEHGATMRGVVGEGGPPIVLEAYAGRVSLGAHGRGQ